TLAELPEVGPFGGLLVRNVSPDGPAARAGIKKDDIIMRVSNRQVDDYDEFISTLAGRSPGDQVTLTVLRDERLKKIKVKLGEPLKDSGGKHAAEGQQCAFLGVLTLPVDDMGPATRDHMGLEDAEGLVVIETVPHSPASRAGLRHGDVITAINGREI